MQPFKCKQISNVMYKIGVNALYLNYGANGGTETYFNNIVRPWYESEQNNVCILLLVNSYPAWWGGEKNWFKIKLFPKANNIINRLITEQFIYPLFLSGKIDLLFNLGYVGSLLLTCPQVNTIHDTFAWVYPKEIGFYKVVYWRCFIPPTARIAKKIIAVSKSTAKDIVKYCGISNDKIAVIHEGGLQFSTSQHTKILEKYNILPKSFFHCVGFFKGIKNPYRIIEAFRAYKLKEPLSKVKLVLAGHVGDKKGMRILHFAENIKDVIYVGRISDSDLKVLYKNSLGLIFPSLYEGFGIPILEAQEYGCAVVTANVSSMPEVAGDGAILVNPLDVDGIANALKYLEFEDTCGLIDLGYKNVSRFSWRKASDQTMNALKSSLASR